MASGPFQILALARRKIVQNAHSCAWFKQGTHDMRTDEPRSPSDQVAAPPYRPLRPNTTPIVRRMILISMAGERCLM